MHYEVLNYGAGNSVRERLVIDSPDKAVALPDGIKQEYFVSLNDHLIIAKNS